MIVTEEEARTKRCQESFPAADALSPGGSTEVIAAPMQTVGMPYGPNGPSVGYGPAMSFARNTAPTHCIASDCMAWRWYWPEITVSVPSTPDRSYGGKDRGYCGKAGKP